MRKIYYFLLALITLLCLNQTIAAKEVLGWVENARIYPGGIELKAKLDTGAKTTSLGCECFNFIERNGKKWIRFTIKDGIGTALTLERKIERMGTIKRHFGESQKRPVIKLGICLSGTYRQTEVNLVDRKGMNYQLLIGRSFLEQHFIIDPAKTFTKKPLCSEAGLAK
ncbi:ATP-dependent zinc protease [Sulfuriflexus mobilis]|uniref:ATP-dependent zinc protease family protein n=1 Tax=Sulfuriflexus mobilis TaxID=1811807 RepID=UPI000F81EF8D|nr:RimK/LysX family protein [Sulfuriflexus mobilis]